MSFFSYIGNLFRPRVERYGNSFFYLLQHPSTFEDIDCLKSYLEIPEVNAAVNMKANAFSNMRLEGQSEKDKELIRVLENPNWFQSQKEFLYQTKVFQEIFGNEFIYTLKPLGMNSLKALYSLPKNLIKVEYTGKSPYFLSYLPEVSYSYISAGGTYVNIPRENLIHIAGPRILFESVTDKSLMMGVSVLSALKAPINNIRMAYESRGVILKNRGAITIISPEGRDAIGNPFPFDPEDIKKIQEQYLQYGTLSGQYQAIIANKPIRAQHLAVNPMNLGLFEETRADFDRIIDSLGIPADLFVRAQGSTYENQKQAELSFYTRTIIPEAEEWVSAINSWFGTTIKATFEHLPVFSHAKEMMMKALLTEIQALNRMLSDGVITLEEYREKVESYLNT